MAATNSVNQYFNQKVHEGQGGNEIIAESGGFITALSGSTITVQSGATLDLKGNFTRASQQRIFNTGAKVGTTAGWVVNAGDDIGLAATCPASQTAATLVIPVPGLKVGDKITAFSIVGQIESVGNAVTIDAALHKHTAVAADVSDTIVGSIATVNETSQATVGAEKTGLSTTILQSETYFVLITATTTALTDIALQGVTVTVTEA